MNITIDPLDFYHPGSPPRLRQNARARAVALVETGKTWGCKAWREPGCTWNGGHPVYQTAHGEYAVGTGRPKEGATQITGTPYWVYLIKRYA